jgi:hypothetical protein
MLKDRLATLKSDRDRAKAALERAKEHAPTCNRSSKALRLTTAKSGSGEARTCLRRRFLQAKTDRAGVRR